MSRLTGSFLLALMAVSAPAAAQSASPDLHAVGQAIRAETESKTSACISRDPADVIVCGNAPQRYRIDPAVTEAERAAHALPPKPPLPDGAPEYACIGQQHCGGDMLPLIPMALTVARAAAMAVNGDDWRQAFRTHPDEYQAYQDAKSSDSRKGGISFGVSAGSR